MLGRKIARQIARHGLVLIATVLVGAFLSAALVRLAPGFDADERIRAIAPGHLGNLREHRDDRSGRAEIAGVAAGQGERAGDIRTDQRVGPTAARKRSRQCAACAHRERVGRRAARQVGNAGKGKGVQGSAIWTADVPGIGRIGANQSIRAAAAHEDRD